MPTLNAQGMKSMRISLMQFTHTQTHATRTCAHTHYTHTHIEAQPTKQQT